MTDTILIFVILHIFLYPASNGYNSYMDRDTGSIGGIENPPKSTKQLFFASILLDAIALILSLFISFCFFGGIVLFIAASKAYSYRGIRLKKYPLTGYLTVIIFQGAIIFFLVMHGCSTSKTLQVPLIGMIAAALLTGSFYPLTQIYQHMQDLSDGVITLSYKLGYRGTFLFSLIVYFIATLTLYLYLRSRYQLGGFIITQILLSPVAVYFLWWFSKVYHNAAEANFKNTMRMNVAASIFTNAAFIYLLLSQKY